MSMKYLRDYYGFTGKRGQRCEAGGSPGVICGADGPYVSVRLDGEKYSKNYHCDDIVFKTPNTTCTGIAAGSASSALSEPEISPVSPVGSPALR